MLRYINYSILLVGILFVLSLNSCNKKSSRSDKNPVDNNLTFTRPNGTQVGFNSRTFVWCGQWEGDEIPANTLNILVGYDSKDPENYAYWNLRAVVSDVEIGEEIKFPNDYVWDQPKGILLFVYDPPNELSNDQEESNGGIVFQKLQCGFSGEVQFTINAMLGSEYHGGDSMRVSGDFYAPYTGPPLIF